MLCAVPETARKTSLHRSFESGLLLETQLGIYRLYYFLSVHKGRSTWSLCPQPCSSSCGEGTKHRWTVRFCWSWWSSASVTSQVILRHFYNMWQLHMHHLTPCGLLCIKNEVTYMYVCISKCSQGCGRAAFCCSFVFYGRRRGVRRSRCGI